MSINAKSIMKIVESSEQRADLMDSDVVTIMHRCNNTLRAKKHNGQQTNNGEE